MSREESVATRDESLDVSKLFESMKGSDNDELENVEVGVSPLDRVANRERGLQISNFSSDGPVHAHGSMTDEKMEGAQKTIAEMNEMIEKAKAVTILSEKPKTAEELVGVIDALDEMDMDAIRRIQAMSGKDIPNAVKENELLGSDVSSDSTVIDESGQDVNSMFTSRQNKPAITVAEVPENQTSGQNEDGVASVSQVIIDKMDTAGESRVIDFTPDEREKLNESEVIELVSVKRLNINIDNIRKPTEIFMSEYKTNMYNAIAESVNMTFTASRFRGNIRGMTFGEYLDIALSAETTEVDKMNKRFTVIYNIMTSTSVRPFVDYDDFLRRFAYADVQLAVYAAYIATNPEVLSTSLRCGKDTCKAPFDVSYKPRNLLRVERLSEYYREIMEKVANASGEVANKLHDESAVFNRSVIELPSTGIGIECGLRSCYEIIHSVLPYQNDMEKRFNELYPDDVNKTRQIISYVFNYISAIYIKDDNGEYTQRVDDLETMVDIIYNLPVVDYNIILAIMNQAEEDYAIAFGVVNVECPKCHTKTAFVPVDIDNEVFQSFQALGSMQVDKKTLPRF